MWIIIVSMILGFIMIGVGAIFVGGNVLSTPIGIAGLTIFCVGTIFVSVNTIILIIKSNQYYVLLVIN